MLVGVKCAEDSGLNEERHDELIKEKKTGTSNTSMSLAFVTVS